MGRELKRVALDFSWPLSKVWKGFINPLYKGRQCPDCENGYSREAEEIEKKWYGNIYFHPSENNSEPFTPETPEILVMAGRNYPHSRRMAENEARRLADHFNGSWCHHLAQCDVDALVAAGRLYDFTHNWARGEGWTPKDPAPIVTAREVNLWSLKGMAHDAINRGVCVDARCKAMGVESTCKTCQGNAEVWDSESDHEAYESWQEIQPPAGEGYQIWETVSEGSPVSPVFDTPEKLAGWMTEEGNDESVTKGTTYMQWLAFIIGPGWSPSLVMTNGIVQDGVSAVVENSGADN